MEKNPAIAKMLPGFIYRYIKRIIHQDFINNLLDKHGQKRGLNFVDAVIEDFNVKFVIRGEENLPSEGRYIFAANHPMGGFDGIILMHILGQKYDEVKFLVNDILLNIKNLEELFVPINKHGGHSREAARVVEEVFQSRAQVLTFPAGLVSRKLKGKVVDLEWKKNFINKSVQYQRDVIPVYMSGRNSNWFYNLARIRKFLGIKWNLEMFYLMDETYQHRDKTIHVVFGKPISYKVFDKSKDAKAWAKEVKNKVYLLKPEEINEMNEIKDEYRP